MVTPALGVAIAIYMSCFSEQDWQRIKELPSHEEATIQASQWTQHRTYLQRLERNYPRGGEAKWLAQSLAAMQYWHLIEAIKSPDASVEERIEVLVRIKQEYPRYWSGQEEPPRLPCPMIYAIPIKEHP